MTTSERGKVPKRDAAAAVHAAYLEGFKAGKLARAAVDSTAPAVLAWNRCGMCAHNTTAEYGDQFRRNGDPAPSYCELEVCVRVQRWRCRR